MRERINAPGDSSASSHDTHIGGLHDYINKGVPLSEESYLFLAHNPDVMFVELGHGLREDRLACSASRQVVSRYNKMLAFTEKCFEITGIEKPPVVPQQSSSASFVRVKAQENDRPRRRAVSSSAGVKQASTDLLAPKG